MPKNGWSGGGFVSGPKKKEKARCTKSIDIPCLLCSANKQMCTSIQFFPSSARTVPAGYLIN